ncbi:hypothetical protein Leryth_018472 [Lithospermum erythrorhizon]|nr:hypothetical protein Leryth_018472 [Lithospermum erythrorhizon]
MKPKPDPDPKARSVIHPNPIPLTTTTTPITSLAVSAVVIFAGSISGTLHSLPLAGAATSTPKSVTISNGTPIIFIELIEVVNKVLLILSDNSLFLVDFELQSQIKKLGVVKVAGGGKITSVSRKFDTRFSLNGVSNNSISGSFVGGNSDLGNGDDVKCSFVIGIGKKIVFLDVNCSRGEFAVVREVAGVGLEKVGVIVGLIWVDDSVIVGSKSGYHLFSCKTGQCSVLFNLPEVESVPRMKLLRRDERGRVILVVDNVGIVVDVEGQPVGGSLVFRGVPEGVGEVGMYVVVVRGGMVEVYHKKSGRCVQVILLGEARNGSCIVSEGDNGNGYFVVLASGPKVICYQKVPAEEQIKDLLRKKSFREAVALMEELESEGELSKEMVSFIHAQVGFLLLFDLHFEDAIDHFLSSETMQPSEVFPLIMRDPNRWSLLVPRNRYWGLHPPPVPLENVIDDGLKAIQKAAFLKKAGVEAAVDDECLLNPPNKADLMESAIKSMIRYLKVSSNKELVASLREGVDTLLMYLYRSLNQVDDMEILASSENFCVVEELETLLNESGHLRTLAFLYASKGMNSKALSIWRLLARNPSSSQKSVAANDLQDASINVAAIEASRILEESSDQDLVVQHMGWIADIDQVLAIHVLISDKRVNMLSPDEIISAIDPKKVEILQRYLQWLIEDQDSDDARFHTMYAVLLAKSALEVCAMESGHLPKMNDSASEIASIFESPVRERLQIFLQSSPASMIRRSAD